MVICEGYFDAIALHRAGVAEAVATCGTALTPDHADELRRRRVGEVILLFDGDSAGQQAMERALEILLRGICACVRSYFPLVRIPTITWRALAPRSLRAADRRCARRRRARAASRHDGWLQHAHPEGRRGAARGAAARR